MNLRRTVELRLPLQLPEFIRSDQMVAVLEQLGWAEEENDGGLFHFLSDPDGRFFPLPVEDRVRPEQIDDFLAQQGMDRLVFWEHYLALG